jgi:hypothetical protein
MKKGFARSALVVALAALPGIVFAQADEAQKEVDKQVAKAISDAISARVTTQVATEGTAPATPNSWYVSAGQITIEQSGANGFDFSVPTIMGGFDRDVRGKMLTGVSLSYSTFDEKIGPADFQSNSFNVSPYFAFLLSPNYFITTKLNVGFTFSTFEVSGPGFRSESDTFSFNYGLGGAFNALHRPGNFVLKGAVRLDWNGFSSTTDSTSTTSTSFGTFTSSSSTSDSDSYTSYGFDAEAGYVIGSRSYLFANYQWTDTTESDSDASTFVNVGFEQKLGKAAALGFKYGTNVGGKDSDPDVQSFFITFRMGF